AHRAAPGADRVRVPGLQPAADVHCGAEHRAALPAGRHHCGLRLAGPAHRHLRADRPAVPQAARALRRPAAAGGDRPCAEHPTGRGVRRRTDRQPGLPLRGGGALLPAPQRARAGPDDRDGHPRPRRGLVCRRGGAARRRPDRRHHRRAHPGLGAGRPGRTAHRRDHRDGPLMLRLTLTQMRASAGRLVAAGIAIVLGTAFVAASLMAGAVMERTTYDAVTARYADADLVLSGAIDADQLEAVRTADGVAAAASTDTASVQLEHGSRSQYVGLGASASDDRLRSETLTEGDLPTQTGQIAVAEGVAERLGLSLGDELTVVQEQWADDPDAPPTTHETALQVEGLIASPTVYLFAPTEAVVSPGDLAAIRAFTAPEDAGTSYEVMVAIDQGADPQAVAEELHGIAGGTLQTQTVDEIAEEQTA